jgi:transcription initiation factor TFIID subunit 12
LMSTNGTTDRKRKPTDQNPENSPAPKHIKIDENTMASVQQPRPGISVSQHQILQAVLAQPQMPEDQKRKYVSGIELLRQTVEQKGPNSQDGQSAQMKIDKIFNHLRQLIQRQQQQTLQNQQIAAGTVPSGAVTGMSAGVSAPVVATAGTSSTISAQSAAAQRWIPPNNVPPHQADQWRTEISSKLNNLGHKLSAAKLQVQEHTSVLERGGHTPEQEAEIRKKLAEAHAGFTQCKEILSGFYQQQKKLQAAKAQYEQQQRQQPSQQGGPGLGVQAPPTGAPQQQRPMPPQQQPHPTQPGMMPGGVVHQPLQQPNIPGRPPQAQTQAQQPMQQQQAQQQIPTPVQRVATPVDPARAGSPPNVNSHVTAMNQARQQQQQQTTTTSMSPNQSNIPLQNQQQALPQVQQQQPPQQQQQQAIGRSPAATNAGTPMTAGPNSPAPRPGSTQPQPNRPQSAAGTPIQGQPQQQLPQQPQQQQPRVPGQIQAPVTTPHVQRETPHQQSRMPIPTTLSVPQPTPVGIPAARPSLSGGANTPGNQILGTPAIIKQPAFEFDEGGMGLLSKRKLEELVKQIDPDEKLDPDVEEVRLPFPSHIFFYIHPGLLLRVILAYML